MSSLKQPLLGESHETVRPSQASGATKDHQPLPSQWQVFKFILLTPLGSSAMQSFVLVLVGVASSIGTGISLASAIYQVGQVYQSINLKDVSEFEKAFNLVVIFTAITVVLQFLATYFMKRIGLMKRIHLNQSLHSQYMSRKRFYTINVFHSHDCDNTDSRLTSDIETMTTELYSTLQVIITQLTNLVYALSLLGNDIFAMIGLSCLCLFALLFFCILSFFFKRTSAVVSNLKKDEGSFSFEHTRIKKNCESIAFYSGHSFELNKIKLVFESVLKGARTLIKSQMILDFLGNLFYFGVGGQFVTWIGKTPHHVMRFPRFVLSLMPRSSMRRLRLLFSDQNLSIRGRSKTYSQLHADKLSFTW
jgi:ABC-type uncharacterized transport system fused permease/ATPase subunit